MKIDEILTTMRDLFFVIEILELDAVCYKGMYGATKNKMKLNRKSQTRAHDGLK